MLVFQVKLSWEQIHQKSVYLIDWLIDKLIDSMIENNNFCYICI